MEINQDSIESFATPEAFCAWLKTNHASANELWLKIFKKASGMPSVTMEQAVIEALAWGWIDGLKKSFDEKAYLLRFTPRTKSSGWSQVNQRRAEALIESGRMQKAGLRQIEAAKADGRWEKAYAGSADMEIPEDFLKALAGNSKAEAMFKTLNRANLFAIYHRVHTARKPQTRQNRIEKIIDMLARGETFY